MVKQPLIIQNSIIMRKIYNSLLTLLLVFGVNTAFAQLIGNGALPAGGGNFDNAGGLAGNGWGTAKNIVSVPADGWAVNTAAGATSGTQAAYVSTNPGAGSPPYGYQTSTPDSLLLFRLNTITVPANQSCITLSFQWKGQGQTDVLNSDLDNLKIYLVPKAAPLTTNDIQVNYQIGQVWYNQQGTFINATFNLDPKLAGNGINYTLTFLWVSNNDAIGTQPPAAIDDVSLTSALPTAVPACVVYTNPSNGSSGLSPCAVTLNWNHSLGCNGATSYQVQTATAFGGPYTTVATVSQNTYNLTGLAALTTYYWRIIPVNSFGANSAGCNFFIYSFTTGTNPVLSGVPPFFEDFESCINWTAYNGAQTNQWFVGSAASASGNRGMYVSNNAGATNAYNINTTSITHIMSNTNIDLTGGGTCINMAFDYRSAGESGFDWLNVYAVPVGYVPTPGSMPVTGALGAAPNLANPVLIAGPLSGQSSYTNFTSSLNGLGLSGYTFKLLFTWRNDNSIGSQPPAAVDNISITATGGPANDAPCTAQFIPPLSIAGLYVPGSNICASNADEPAQPGCWTNTGGAGQINTVWFRFKAPSTATPCVKIRTERGTLVDTQIAVYSLTPSGAGTVACGSGSTLTLLACNDNRPGCGSSTYTNSELTVTGLSPGFTYYIAVDGKNGQVGTFSLFIMDGGGATGCSNPFPPVPGADCASPNLVCSSTTFTPNPGYQGFGAKCDFSGGICLASGDRGGSWYQVTIDPTSTPGTFLNFDIVPNDWTGFSSTDYDFGVWKVGGAGATTCAGITASPATGLVACNYSALGVTGCYTGGNSPAAYPGYNGAYEPSIVTQPGEVYLIFVSNFSNSTSGFSLFTTNSTCVITASVPNGNAILWTGSVSSDWTNPLNWGGCNVPSCSGVNGETDALIPSLYVNPPIITGAVSCRNLTINPGATLTIAGTGVLEVCKDLNNNGSFNCQVGSRVILDGPNTGTYAASAGIQNLDGALTGANGFYNLDVFKTNTAYAVNANQDFDVKGNFKIGYNTGAATTNTTTYFESAPSGNGKYVKVGGDFLVFQNAGLTSTYNTVSNSVLEFNGAANQNYMNKGTISSLTMNQSVVSTLTVQSNGGGTPFLNMGTSGILTLTSGKIVVTGANTVTGIPTYSFVQVQNTSAAAIVGQNANSYIQGGGAIPFYVLRKNTTGAVGTYNLPVGTSAKYSNLQLNVTTALTPNPAYFFVGFDNTAPASNTDFNGMGVAVNDECSVKYHQGRTALNNGLWRVLLGAVTSPGAASKLDVSVVNSGYTNVPMGSGWTIMANKTNAPATATSWFVNPLPAGPCLTSGPVNVTRLGMSWASLVPAATSTPIMFGTAQSATPLPVELLRFTAQSKDKAILLNWSTASELINKGFEVERSTSGSVDFEKIGWVTGHGTSNVINDYTFTDYRAQAGVVYYYRLKQIDDNGLYEYTKTVAASVNDDKVSFTISPNPYSGQTNIAYRLDQTSDVTLEVINKLGQKVTTVYKGSQEPGSYIYPFSAKSYGYASGVYTVRITINNQTYTRMLFEND